MASEGVSTKPILLISGSSPFCETFFDDVKVPKSYGEDCPAQVGEINRGWDVAKYLLGHEREMISGAGGGDRTATISRSVAHGGPGRRFPDVAARRDHLLHVGPGPPALERPT